MEENIKLICITCPKGCTLEVSREGESIVTVKQGCKRGHEYAEEELTNPRRMVATTVKVKGGQHPLLPVYTASLFPKPRIRELLKVLRDVEVEAPISMNQVILENVLETGVDVIASRDMIRTEQVE
jgi:CxxC motif-containing protein